MNSHVHTLARRLPPVRLEEYGVTRSPDLSVAEALLAARIDQCPTCPDQLTALVLRGDPLVIAHLVGQAWTAWRYSPEGEREGAVIPVSARSGAVLRLMLSRDHRTMVDYLDQMGPADLIELLDDALALLAPHRAVLPRSTPSAEHPRHVA